MLGLNKNTGELLWRTQVDDHFAAFVTQSAQVNGNTAYVGVASNEEAFSNQDLSGGIPYTCCSFRGSSSRSTRTQARSSGPPTRCPQTRVTACTRLEQHAGNRQATRRCLHHDRQQLLLPADRITCVDEATTFEAKQACLAGDNFDAIMSLNIHTGAINWSHRALASDAWNTDCGLPGFSEGGTNPGNCPENAGP